MKRPIFTRGTCRWSSHGTTREIPVILHFKKTCTLYQNFYIWVAVKGVVWVVQQSLGPVQGTPNSFPFPFTVGYVNWLFDLSKRHYLPNIVKLNIHHATVDCKNTEYYNLCKNLKHFFIRWFLFPLIF